MTDVTEQTTKRVGGAITTSLTKRVEVQGTSFNIWGGSWGSSWGNSWVGPTVASLVADTTNRVAETPQTIII